MIHAIKAGANRYATSLHTLSFKWLGRSVSSLRFDCSRGCSYRQEAEKTGECCKSIFENEQRRKKERDDDIDLYAEHTVITSSSSELQSSSTSSSPSGSYGEFDD